jgi:uncharacterized membrane protein
MEAITLVFAVLFLAQTAVFVFLYRNAVTRRDITEKKAPKPEKPSETEAEEKEAPLHESAIKALQLIRERGSVTSRDVSRSLGLSREHTARVMKSLHERGLVLREGKPFKYSLTPQGERVLREGSG